MSNTTLTPDQKNQLLQSTFKNVVQELTDIQDIIPAEKHWVFLMAIGILSTLMVYFTPKTTK